MTPASLPDKIIASMSPADRRRLGVQTAEEAMLAFTIRSEGELQKQIAGLLRYRGIRYLNPSMAKKSPLPIGWADFTIFLPPGRVIFMECKVEGGKMRKEQAEFGSWAMSGGFHHCVVTSLKQAIEHLEAGK